MKTPRELLFERHRHTQPRLDALREKVVAGFSKAEEMRPKISWSETLISLRWHVAALSGAWMLIFFLNMESHASPSASVAGANSSSPVQILAALHEQRRQLLEWAAEQSSAFVPIPPAIPRPRRSELQNTNISNFV
jgi:hypothetical protein